MSKNPDNNSDVDISMFINTLLKQKWYIIFATAISISIGFYYVLKLPNYYTSSMVLVSEKSEDGAGGSLSKLTSLAGISIPKSGA
ncbi:Wzz/FepE/Etk N-terminal domain-containing protein, partial [Streptococcus suis]